MPTGRCSYPQHHSPSAGPPFGLLGAIAVGAIIIAFAHAIVVALVVVAILGCAAGAVFLLIHNHGSGYDPELERQAAAAEAQRQSAAAQLAASQPRAIEQAPAVHNHLHLHGVDASEVASLVTRHHEQQHAIEEARPW